MKIYIAGISGTGMGPLALMAKNAGYEVYGSDLSKGAIYSELIKAGVEVEIGKQDGEFLSKKLEKGVDWFVYTSALPEDHDELKMAREAGIKCTKRDELTAFLVEKLGLKMVAVAGTHGKTTTTSMIVWLALKLGLPVSYIVGTTLGFAPSGSYKPGDKYFVYEADEYDRNFLKFHPWLAVIVSISYDHPDIYPNKKDYEKAFLQFKSQSEMIIDENDNLEYDDMIKLAGEARRQDASLAIGAIKKMLADSGMDANDLFSIINKFPGVGRRFEKIADGIYSDYAHHPEEIAATVKIAREEANITGRSGVVVLYQPHQNTRQHEVRAEYKDVFVGADKVLWLATYLTRENPNLAILTPQDLINGLSNKEKAEAVELDDDLAKRLRKYIDDGYLVVLMTAGPADKWLRNKFTSSAPTL